MLIEYMTLGRDLVVTHTPIRKDGRVLVHFEKPSLKYGFKEFECYLPECAVKTNIGFSLKDVNALIKFCRNNAEIILYLAKVGGFKFM